MTADPPRLKNPTFQRRGTGDASELRTVTTPTPHKPISAWHRAYWWLHHHLTRDRSGEWKDDSGWKAQRSTVAHRSGKSYRERERANDRDVRETAQHAQSLREEAATMGAGKGSRERADFYGGKHGSHTDRAESRVRGGGTAQREAHEATQRTADKQRRERGFRW